MIEDRRPHLLVYHLLKLLFDDLSRIVRYAMTDVGIVVTILLVAIDSILTDPVRLPVGRYTMQSSVRDAIERSVFATVHWQ